MENQTQDQTPEQLQEQTQDQAPAKEKDQKPAKAEKPAKPAKAEKPANNVDSVKYNKFTELKFMQLSGTKLTDELKKQLENLESELKECTGKVSIRTVRAAIGNEQCLLVAGIPVTPEIENIIGEKHSAYYFGE